MPTGVYIRSKEQIQQICERLCKLNQRPKTQKQREASRNNINKVHGWNSGLTKKTDVRIAAGAIAISKAVKGKNRGNGFDKKALLGDDIVCHHNDLCHGALRPDDISHMTNRKHCRLHGLLKKPTRNSLGQFTNYG